MYIAEERPDTGDVYLFLSEIFPHSPIGGNGIASIVGRAFQAAGIRQNAGDRKGSHLFRHYLASALLENGVPQPVISRTLGHTAPESLEPYLKTDFVHLKECALSIRQFPLSMEVLAMERAICLDVMRHAYMFMQSGIPVLYSGDEIGQVNDYSYEKDPNKAADSRYFHRGAMRWELAKKADDPDTVEGKLFGRL